MCVWLNLMCCPVIFLGKRWDAIEDVRQCSQCSGKHLKLGSLDRKGVLTAELCMSNIYINCKSDLLRAGRSGDRIPVGATFYAPVQAGPGAQPASYTMGTRSFQGVKRLGRGVDHPPPSSAVVEGRVELYICSPSGPSWPVLG